MNLDTVAATNPDKPAVIMGAGDELRYQDLARQSRQLAALLYERGLRAGSHVAIMMDNTTRYFPAAWAAQRSGLFYTPVNWHLTAAEAAYIVADCGAQALITTSVLGELAHQIVAANHGPTTLFMGGGAQPGFEDYEAALLGVTDAARPDEVEGHYMFYSSGTTGRPKGIKPKLTGAPFGTGLAIDNMLPTIYGFGADTTYLCPGPLYHAAPLGWSLATQRNGGTVVVMEKFDAEQALALIESHHVTHAQFVPTMFVRILKLPAEVRSRYDLSSLRAVVHAAAPCPVAVKEQMIEWLGPIVHEYYAGSEGNCFFMTDSTTWLAHKGTVGKAVLGTAHILDDDGQEVPNGEVGQIWFEGGGTFEYHNDPGKTAGVYNDRGWSTLGDLGHLDDEGFLFLSDRRSDLILTGGVNVYPQEVEEVLAMHVKVADVAVIGVADEEMGQRVVAVVQPEVGIAPSPALAEELIEFCKVELAGFKRPRTISFDPDLPRLPSGKILRREVRDRYVAGGATK